MAKRRKIVIPDVINIANRMSSQIYIDKPKTLDITNRIGRSVYINKNGEANIKTGTKIGHLLGADNDNHLLVNVNSRPIKLKMKSKNVKLQPVSDDSNKMAKFKFLCM